MNPLALALPVVLVAVGISSAGAHRLPKAPGCPILPKSHAFNQRVDRLPVARNSETLVNSIGADVRSTQRRSR